MLGNANERGSTRRARAGTKPPACRSQGISYCQAVSSTVAPPIELSDGWGADEREVAAGDESTRERRTVCASAARLERLVQ